MADVVININTEVVRMKGIKVHVSVCVCVCVCVQRGDLVFQG